MQRELLAYLENTVDKFHLRDNLRLSCRVTRVEWDAQDCSYIVSAEDGTSESYDVVVSAVGLLNNPRYPDWPGLSEFAGVKFHSARWNYDCDITDKVVAVVGTGSTAAQIVPAIAPDVKKLYVYQRQPGWVVPKGEKIYDSRRTGEVDGPQVEVAGLVEAVHRLREEVALRRSRRYAGEHARPGGVPQVHRYGVRRSP